jgi:hypothetical protein
MEVAILTGDELSKKIREAVKTELHALNLASASDESDALMKRADVAKMFGVSIATVHNWMNLNYLPFHHIGSRTFFKKNEVIQAMKQVRLRKRVS